QGIPDGIEPDSNWYENVTNLQIIFGLLAVLGLVSLTVSVVYVKRKQARLLVEMVERMVLMQKMKKTLLKKGLYAEYSQVQLKSKLGDGNFGEVYQAEVQTKDKGTLEVAIKKLRKGISSSHLS